MGTYDEEEKWDFRSERNPRPKVKIKKCPYCGHSDYQEALCFNCGKSLEVKE